ncbi:MAG: amidohydrolase family protein, partial [Pseudomonadota bacterium]
AGNFERAHKAGVRIAYGTDSGISPHGTNAEEAVRHIAVATTALAAALAAEDQSDEERGE